MRGQDLCFFHLRDRRREDALARSMAARRGWVKRALENEVDLKDPGHVAVKDALTDELFLSFEIPTFEDANSIQEAATSVFRAVATGQITESRAKCLFSYLNLAHKNVHRVRFKPLEGETVATDLPEEPESLPADMTSMLLEDNNAQSDWNENSEAELESSEEEFGERHLQKAPAPASLEPAPSSTTP